MIFPLAVLLSVLAAEDGPRVVAGPAIRLTEPVAIRVSYAVEAPRKVNAKSPKRLRIGERTVKLAPGGVPAEAEIQPGDAQDGQVSVETEYYVCAEAPDSPCLRRQVRFTLAVDSKHGQSGPVRLETPLFR